MIIVIFENLYFTQ